MKTKHKNGKKIRLCGNCGSLEECKNKYPDTNAFLLACAEWRKQ
ncbi:hypothetical protein AAIR98_000920 [Elusimicrobium simillimum]